jgi:hypothetical protein
MAGVWVLGMGVAAWSYFAEAHRVL